MVLIQVCRISSPVGGDAVPSAAEWLWVLLSRASDVIASLEGPEPCPASHIPMLKAEGVLAEAEQPAQVVAAIDGAVMGYRKE